MRAVASPGLRRSPSNGETWQVMRTSRNRNWAHPAMISLIEKLADDAKKYDGWNRLLIGDIAQRRRAPMRDGHASHQMGLDARYLVYADARLHALEPRSGSK